jgi:two-component system, LytTR family, sensor kinase
VEHADRERSAPAWPHPLVRPVGLAALAFLSVGQVVVVHAAMFEALGRGVRWSVVARAGVVNLVVWAVLLIPVRFVIQRFPLGGDRLWSRLAIHIVAGVAFATLHATLYIIGIGQGGDGELASNVHYILVRRLYLDAFIYGALVCADWAARLWRRERQQALHAVELERSLAEAQLLVLRGQLQPHFLFNTLHAVSTLMHRDVDAADRVLGRLAELLRASLRSLQAPEISLREEILLLEPFLEIARTRFQDRLAIEIAIDDGLDDVKVPALVLQPLVENALQHGIARRRSGGRIWIGARLRAAGVELSVEDDGAGPHAPIREGVGLGSTRARLARLYPDAHELVLEPRGGGGTCVRVVIPHPQEVA